MNKEREKQIREEGKAEGMAEGKAESVRDLLAKRLMTIEQISYAFDMPVEEVRRIARQA